MYCETHMIPVSPRSFPAIPLRSHNPKLHSGIGMTGSEMACGFVNLCNFMSCVILTTLGLNIRKIKSKLHE